MNRSYQGCVALILFTLLQVNLACVGQTVPPVTSAPIASKAAQEKVVQNKAKQVAPPSASDQQQKPTNANSLSPLISAADLKALLDKGTPSLRILEPAVNSKGYMKGHIPTARYLHWVTDMTDPAKADKYNNLSSSHFGELMNGLGVNNDSRIVIYDRLSSRLSTRLFWTLKYFGHEKVQILNGGHEAWVAQQEEQSTEVVELQRAQYKVPKPNVEILAEMDFVQEHLNKPNARFIDGRPAEQFKGEVAGRVFHTKQPHSRKGHIPNAINIFWKDNFNQDGTFKSKDQLRQLYRNSGIKPDQCVVTYCNEGLHAAPPWFVLTQLLGYEDVRLYDSSMAEWANSKNPMDILEKTDANAQKPQEK